MTWQFVLTGLLIGTLVGVTGMGGGSLLTPLLVIVLGFQPAVAVGTDLFHGAIFKTVGAARHHRLGTVQARPLGLDVPWERSDVFAGCRDGNVADATVTGVAPSPRRVSSSVRR